MSGASRELLRNHTLLEMPKLPLVGKELRKGLGGTRVLLHWQLGRNPAGRLSTSRLPLPAQGSPRPAGPGSHVAPHNGSPAPPQVLLPDKR